MGHPVRRRGAAPYSRQRRYRIPPRLREGLRGARTLQAAGATRPLEWFRPTRPQLDFLRAQENRVLLRGPNQPGKTQATCVDVLLRMLGRHPWVRRHRPPIECWVVCSSWKQSLVIQRKMYDLLPKDELHPKSTFTRRNGFTGASFQTRNGSLCTFVTVQQDTMDLASATLHHIAIDEVPPEHVWAELAARVRHHQGQIKLTATPINRPVEWLREKVRAGEIRDIHFELTVEACWPIGATRPFQTQEQIDQFVADCPPWQINQRVKGEWEGATQNRWLREYDETRHVGRFRLLPGATLGIGIDYGLQPGKACAALVQVIDGGTAAPDVLVVDEACAPRDESWATEDLVEGILAMLERNGLKYDDIDVWVGDRSAQGSSRKMENAMTRSVMAARLRRTVSSLKYIETPRKYEGSVAYGCAVMNGLLKRDRMKLHSRTIRVQEFCSHFKGDPTDKVKDAGDAARYAIVRMSNPNQWFSFKTELI